MSETSNPVEQDRYCTNCGSSLNPKAEVCPDCGVSQGDRDGMQSQRSPSSRWKAAFIGSVVAFFLGWIPFLGPIGAGSVSGYLRGVDNTESAITGFLGTFLASIPMVLFGALLFTGIVVEILTGEMETAVGGIAGTLIIVVIPLIYFYFCGALGGYIGAEFSNRSAPRSN